MESVSIGAEDNTAEQSLIHNDASFYYLQEEELRTLTATTEAGRIPFDDFLCHLGMHIESRNLYKTGKYISRVFRPTST